MPSEPHSPAIIADHAQPRRAAEAAKTALNSMG
jgi:hypothetical protein